MYWYSIKSTKVYLGGQFGRVGVTGSGCGQEANRHSTSGSHVNVGQRENEQVFLNKRGQNS